MKRLIAALALSSLSLLTPVLHATNTVGTFSCPSASGDYLPDLEGSVYYFSFDVDQTDNIIDATIYLNNAILPKLLFSEGSTYSECIIVAGGKTIAFHTAVNQAVSETKIASGFNNSPEETYSGTLLTFQDLSISGTTVSVKGPFSAETLAKVKDNFKARSGLGIPKSSTIQ